MASATDISDRPSDVTSYGEDEPLLGATGDASQRKGKALYHNLFIGRSSADHDLITRSRDLPLTYGRNCCDRSGWCSSTDCPYFHHGLPAASHTLFSTSTAEFGWYSCFDSIDSHITADAYGRPKADRNNCAFDTEHHCGRNTDRWPHSHRSQQDFTQCSALHLDTWCPWSLDIYTPCYTGTRGLHSVFRTIPLWRRESCQGCIQMASSERLFRPCHAISDCHCCFADRHCTEHVKIEAVVHRSVLCPGPPGNYSENQEAEIRAASIGRLRLLSEQTGDFALDFLPLRFGQHLCAFPSQLGLCLLMAAARKG